MSVLLNDFVNIETVDEKMVMKVEQSVEWELARGDRILGENLP
jgi:hypothetical protein